MQDLFGVRPPINVPIFCHFGKFASPITSLDNWSHPSLVNVFLTTDGHFPAQFAYQLGHELGHVMLNPRRTNGIIETICTALAYEVLDRLRDKWAMVTPPGIARGYEENFRDYRLLDEKDRLATFPDDVQRAVGRNDWGHIRRYLQLHEAEQRQLSSDAVGGEHGRGRNLEALGAMALRAAPITWRKFLNLGDCTIPNTKVDPSFRYLPLTSNCITRLTNELCRMGKCRTAQR